MRTTMTLTNPPPLLCSTGVAPHGHSCTPRKVVPKMSNQIVGLKKVQHEDDDDDVADVFKL